MKTKDKKLAMYSPTAMAAYFLGKAESYRLTAQFESCDIARQGFRQMMRDNALRHVSYLRQIGGAS